MPNIQIRDVPTDVHRRLKSQAAMEGVSLNEFLLARIIDIARLPTMSELVERVQARPAYEGPSSAAVIQQERSAR